MNKGRGYVPDPNRPIFVFDCGKNEWITISREGVIAQLNLQLFLNPFLAAFLAFQAGKRDYEIEPLQYAAYTHAAYTWLVRRWEKPPPIHPLYGDIGAEFQVVQSAHEAYDQQLVPVYWAELGFLAVPRHLIQT